MTGGAQPAIVSPRLSPPAWATLLPIGAGLALLGIGGLALAVFGVAPWNLLSLLHLGFVGGLLPIALGASLQLSAATTGRRLPAPHLASGAATAVAMGGALLALGFALSRWALVAAAGLWVVLALLYLGPRLLYQALRARPFTPLHLGLAIGSLSFLAAGVLGTLLALARAGFGMPLAAILPWHLAAALGCGFAALLRGVSWQLSGMFAQIPYAARRTGYWQTALLAAAALLGAALYAFGAESLSALPPAAMLLLWALGTARAAGQKRPAAGPSPSRLAALLVPWQLALAACALALGLTGPALLLVAFSVAIAEYGFLERILPFLVWQARMQPGVRGGGSVPKLPEILPPRLGLPLLYALVLLVGSAALGIPGALRAAGLVLASLSLRLLLALRRLRA